MKRAISLMVAATTGVIGSSGPYAIGKNSITLLLDKGDVVRPWWFANTSGGTYNDAITQMVVTKVK